MSKIQMLSDKSDTDISEDIVNIKSHRLLTARVRPNKLEITKTPFIKSYVIQRQALDIE